jgi:hypothetical protein
VGRREWREGGAEDLDVVTERRAHRRDVGDRREVERQRVGEDQAGQLGELLEVRDVGIPAEQFDEIGTVGERVHGKALLLTTTCRKDYDGLSPKSTARRRGTGP